MSLETTIAENTAAVLALTAALMTRAGAPDNLSSTPTSAKRATKKPAEPGATAPARVETAPATGSDAYTDAATAITELSRLNGREAALKVLASFDATKLPGVAQDRLAEVAVAARQAMEASE